MSNARTTDTKCEWGYLDVTIQISKKSDDVRVARFSDVTYPFKVSADETKCEANS